MIWEFSHSIRLAWVCLNANIFLFDSIEFICIRNKSRESNRNPSPKKCGASIKFGRSTRFLLAIGKRWNIQWWLRARTNIRTQNSKCSECHRSGGKNRINRSQSKSLHSIPSWNLNWSTKRLAGRCLIWYAVRLVCVRHGSSDCSMRTIRAFRPG